ncbi:MAG TPA: PqiC family protein [Steroidobacteraceae bacterium]|jgi:uncharacterized lipoprotein YmbA|nr:PqiC family protein [Steroidobacteraceae bacterium]
MRRERTTAVLALAALVVACGSSPPVRFFKLDAVEPAASQPATQALVKVVAVHIPRLLDRREVVQQSEANRVTLSGQERWAAPLADMIRTVLTQDLVTRLGAEHVILPDAPAPPGTIAVVVDILRFETEPSGAVVFTGSYSFFDSGRDEPRARHEVELAEPARSGDAADQARAMSVVLGRVADRIAADLS